MLNDAVTPIPYAFNAWKKLTLQSRQARLIGGNAARSVSHFPSLPPLKATPLVCTVNCVLFVTEAMLKELPADPMARAVIVKTAPSALAHTPFDPALIINSMHVATLCGVSPIRLMWLMAVPAMVTVVVFPNSLTPPKATVAS